MYSTRVHNTLYLFFSLKVLTLLGGSLLATTISSQTFAPQTSASPEDTSTIATHITPASTESSSTTAQAGNAEPALIDLEHVNWGKGNAFTIAGYWDFAFEELVSPDNASAPRAWSQIPVPGAWDKHHSNSPFYDSSQAHEPLPPIGYGTYRVRLKVPEHLTELYLYMPDMASAYTLWSNNQLQGGNGRVATDKASEQPDYLPTVYTLAPDENGTVNILIQTSNFHYQWGGIWYAPKVTDKSGLHSLREQPLIQATATGTILLTAAMFALFLYFSRPKEYKTLYFSLFCFAIGIRRLTIDERILYLLDVFDWNTLQTLENLSTYLSMPAFLAYFCACFPKVTPRWLPKVGLLLSVPFCLAAIFLEVATYTKFNIPFQLSMLATIPIVLFCYGKAFLLGHRGARMFGLSLLVFLAAVMNDVLNYSYIIQTPNMIHVGALAFVLFQLASLIQRYLSNFREIESLSNTLQAQNKELIKLDEFKDDFLASTSHELRTPLHGIAGLARIINKENIDLSPTTKRQLELIETSSNRLGSLVNDLLDISSLKHDKLKLSLHPVQIEPVLAATTQSLLPLIKNKSVKLNYQIAEDADFILADEQRFQQILFNLIGNAIKFTEQGHISIDVSKLDNHALFKISDTGIGIPETELKTLLKPFESRNLSSDPNLTGTGLGLPITDKLVRLHQGELTIRSTQSIGTTVEFSIPLANPSQKENDKENIDLYEQEAYTESGISIKSRSTSPTKAPELTKGALIYFVDDEAVNRELISSQLTRAGYQVEIFDNGDNLLTAINQKLPELAILDWMMPGKSGLEVCRQIRQTLNRFELPLMMLTAKQQPKDIVEALNSGANDYLTKPYFEEELHARVNSLLSVRRLLESSRENARLQDEITVQTDKQRLLELKNRQLASTMDSADSCLLLLNDEFDIIFSNHKADILLENLTSLSPKEHSQTEPVSLLTLLNQSNLNKLQTLVEEQVKEPFSIQLKSPEGSGENLQAQIYNFQDQAESYTVLNLSQETDTQSPEDTLSKLAQELAENRQKMSEIESTLLKLKAEEVEMESSELTIEEKDPKELVVQTLRTALLAWERYTHKTKADLAESSRTWRVYIDGTTAKTRTLDKYLSVKTLPAKPRWRAVIKTANYVLDNCDLNEADQAQLSQLIEELNQAYA